jgi:hypothetical protein
MPVIPVLRKLKQKAKAGRSYISRSGLKKPKIKTKQNLIKIKTLYKINNNVTKGKRKVEEFCL